MKFNNPIVIGGLGGSGTRVVAELLKKQSIYIGGILNKANDNLLFSRLFKRPLWLAASQAKDIHLHLSTFEKYMEGKRWTVQDCLRYFNSSPKYIPGQKFRMRLGYQFMLHQFFKFNQSRPNKWGWKEPNSHIFLPYLIDYFKDLKYIYVVRHGLDMAFSKNQQQLVNWGPLFGIEPPHSPLAQFNYWLAA
ncbi:MAG: hypothetical protein AAFP19_26680, partial [Bacteroidota bacterium]